MGSTGKGKPAEEHFENSWKRYGKDAHCYRIPDSADIQGLNKGRLNHRIIVDKKPADFFVTWQGEMFWAEVKTTAEKHRFKLDLISSYQRNFALRTVRAGGAYYFFVYTVFGWIYRIPAGMIVDEVRPSLTFEEDLKDLRWLPFSL